MLSLNHGMTIPESRPGFCIMRGEFAYYRRNRPHLISEKFRFKNRHLRTVWCGREDSNFHGLSPTTTSTLRVYQFRHDRTQSASEANLNCVRRLAPVGRSAPLAAGTKTGKHLFLTRQRGAQPTSANTALRGTSVRASSIVTLSPAARVGCGGWTTQL